MLLLRSRDSPSPQGEVAAVPPMRSELRRRQQSGLPIASVGIIKRCGDEPGNRSGSGVVMVLGERIAYDEVDGEWTGMRIGGFTVCASSLHLGRTKLC